MSTASLGKTAAILLGRRARASTVSLRLTMLYFIVTPLNRKTTIWYLDNECTLKDSRYLLPCRIL